MSEHNTITNLIINTPDETDEFLTDERCQILEILNDSTDRSQSLARARVELGVTTAWHRLIDTSETLYFLEGEGLLELGEDYSKTVKKGDVVKIPNNCPQRVTNTGLEDLVFLCFCVPGFGSACYESLE